MPSAPPSGGLAGASGRMFIRADHRGLGRTYRLYCEAEPELLFTDNEMNFRRLWGVENTHLYVKDAFHDYVVHGLEDRGEPGFRGHEGGCVLSARPRRGRERRGALAPERPRAEGDPFGDALRSPLRAAAARGR